MLILASTSPYRRQLLERLRLPFRCLAPGTDERALCGERPADLAGRLAAAKAAAIAQIHPQAWVIGSDQCAELDGHVLGKPGNRPAAIAQLQAMSGRTVDFHTAVCLRRGDQVLATADLTRVRLRPLEPAAIERYLDAEQPYDCAGSFKCEGLGIALFEAIDSTDPTALIGLPLIALAGLLRATGHAVP